MYQLTKLKPSISPIPTVDEKGVEVFRQLNVGETVMTAEVHPVAKNLARLRIIRIQEVASKEESVTPSKPEGQIIDPPTTEPPAGGKSDDKKGDPKKDEPKPDPKKDEPKPDPKKAEDPKKDPKKDEPEGDPKKDDPKPDPKKDTKKDEPKPDPKKDEPKKGDAPTGDKSDKATPEVVPGAGESVTPTEASTVTNNQSK